MATYELERLVPGDPELAVIALTGELDLTNTADLVERLAEAAAEKKQLVLDLSRLVFIDSAAIRCLFRVVRERGSTGVAFVIEPTAPIAATLEIVGLRRAAAVAATIAEAESALAEPRSA